jgi:Putative MetA-pathway of phenol degradation
MMHSRTAFARSLSVVLVVAALAATPQPAQALDLNGFLPAAGETTLALSYTAESWDEFWVGTRKVSDPGVGEADIRSLSLWGRYGFTDRLALVFNLPYVDAESDGLGGFEQASVQDLAALLQYELLQRQAGAFTFSLSAALGGRVPVEDYDANRPVDVGDGTSDVLTRVVAQLRGERFFVSQQIGFDLRGDDAPDQFPLYTEAGLTTGLLTWSAFLSVLVADGGTDIGDPGFTFPSNKEEFERVGAKLYARLSPSLGLAAGGFTTLDGRNTSKATGFFLSGVVSFGR